MKYGVAILSSALLAAAVIPSLPAGAAAQGAEFNPPQIGVRNYSYLDGYRVDQHVRLLGDVNGDHRADIVGFGRDATFVSLGQATGTFAAPKNVTAKYSYADGWRVDRHVRLLADVNGDQLADIVGFGESETWVSRG
jgi:hypothetical protein